VGGRRTTASNTWPTLVFLLALISLLSGGCARTTLLAPRMDAENVSAMEIVVAEESGGREVILNEEERVEWISRLVGGYRGSWTAALNGEVASVMVLSVTIRADWGRDVSLAWSGGSVANGVSVVSFRGGHYWVDGDHRLNRELAALYEVVK